jgi:flagellar biosynthesis/type III secretory pathway ATPase
MPDVTSVEHRLKAGRVRGWLSTLRDSEDLVSVGAYVTGSTPRIDEALAKRDTVEAFLRQPTEHAISFDESVDALLEL